MNAFTLVRNIMMIRVESTFKALFNFTASLDAY